MRHKVSGIFVCEVEGNTRKEVMIETARAVQEGRVKLHVMEVEDERKTKKKQNVRMRGRKPNKAL